MWCSARHASQTCLLCFRNESNAQWDLLMLLTCMWGCWWEAICWFGLRGKTHSDGVRVISFYNRFSAAVPEEAAQGGKRGRLLQESNILQFCGQHLKTLELPQPAASATVYLPQADISSNFAFLLWRLRLHQKVKYLTYVYIYIWIYHIVVYPLMHNHFSSCHTDIPLPCNVTCDQWKSLNLRKLL